MTIDEYLEQHNKEVANMTLSQAREVIARSCSHTDMRIEFEKAVSMLLDCADAYKKIVTEINEKFEGCDICEYCEDYDYDENDVSEYRSVGSVTDILAIINKYTGVEV